jgi:hypothetical protein
VHGWLAATGFADIRSERVEKRGTSPSVAEAAIGLIEGNPIHLAIMERRASALGEIEAALAENLAAALGDRPLRCPLRTIFIGARRP